MTILYPRPESRLIARAGGRGAGPASRMFANVRSDGSGLPLFPGRKLTKLTPPARVRARGSRGGAAARRRGALRTRSLGHETAAVGQRNFVPPVNPLSLS
jgi:hypothetical protein